MYALNEAIAAMSAPGADTDAVIEQLEVSHVILGACLDNMEITTMADISEDCGKQYSGATAKEITDDELDTYS